MTVFRWAAPSQGSDPALAGLDLAPAAWTASARTGFAAASYPL